MVTASILSLTGSNSSTALWICSIGGSTAVAVRHAGLGSVKLRMRPVEDEGCVRFFLHGFQPFADERGRSQCASPICKSAITSTFNVPIDCIRKPCSYGCHPPTSLFVFPAYPSAGHYVRHRNHRYCDILAISSRSLSDSSHLYALLMFSCGSSAAVLWVAALSFSAAAFRFDNSSPPP